MSVDLHIHTLASDGRWTALQVYEAAVATELKMVSITDHDTTRALEEAEAFAWPEGLQFVPGIEFSTDIPGHEVHVLGYGMDWRRSFFLHLFQIRLNQTYSTSSQSIGREEGE